MTLQECLDKTRKLMNYYSISGEIVSAQDPVQRDYRFRALAAIDTAQKELAARRPLIRHISFTQHTLRALDSLPGFRRLSGTLCLEAPAAGAFSLMCDGDLTLQIEMQCNGKWESLYRHFHTGNGQLECLAWESPAGTILPDTPVRLSMESSSAFLADAALFAAFPEHEDIPVLGARRFRNLPENFCRLISCRPEGRLGQILRTGFARIEKGKIGFPWDFDGAVQLEYTAYPAGIDENSDPGTELELGQDAAEAIPFYTAAMLLTEENPKLSEFFLHTYTAKLRALETMTGFQIRNRLFGGYAR